MTEETENALKGKWAIEGSFKMPEGKTKFIISYGVNSERDGPAGYVGNFEAPRELVDLIVATVNAARDLRRIVEGIDGTMNHGTWRDDNGNRLKDTPEWVSFYNASSVATSR